PISRVRLDQEADLTVRRTAETIDLAFEAGGDFQNGLPQRLALDEVIRQLIERPIEIRVEPVVALVDADENLAVKKVVPVERKTGAFADDNAIAAPRGEEFVGNLLGLVENIEKDFQLRIVEKKEPNGRLVEYRTDKVLARCKCAGRRLYLRKIIKRENDALSTI